jgi:hypothetical protein
LTSDDIRLFSKQSDIPQFVPGNRVRKTRGGLFGSPVESPARVYSQEGSVVKVVFEDDPDQRLVGVGAAFLDLIEEETSRS